jgi:hypothetical protein
MRLRQLSPDRSPKAPVLLGVYYLNALLIDTHRPSRRRERASRRTIPSELHDRRVRLSCAAANRLAESRPRTRLSSARCRGEVRRTCLFLSIADSDRCIHPANSPTSMSPEKPAKRARTVLACHRCRQFAPSPPLVPQLLPAHMSHRAQKAVLRWRTTM